MNLRIFKIFLIFLSCAAFMVGSAFAEGDQGVNKNPGLYKPDGSPIRAFLNINNISTIIKNTGISDIDVGESNSGLIFPKGSGKAAIFISGLVWGAFVDEDPAQVRVGGSTYAEGLQGGAILDNGTVEDPDAEHVRIYRVRPTVYVGAENVDVSVEANDEGKSESDVQAQYELDWAQWPAEFGAPYFDGNDNGMYDPDPSSGDIPGVPGADQTIWYVANDQASTKTQDLYGTLPMGMEMQLTCWAYSQTGALGNMFFRKYVLINKTDKLGNPQNFNDMYVSMWSDPDVGNSTDDYAGSDTVLSLSFAYNALANDPTYNPLPPPAAGFDFFQGPLLDGVAGEDRNKNGVDDAEDYAIYNGEVVGPGKINLPMTASYYFARGDANVTDPTLASSAGADQFYNFMQGKIGLTGEFFVDPNTLLETTYTLTGNPQTGQGWVDGQLIGPGDRRIGMAAGPFLMEPGDTQEVVVAEIIAGAIPGVDRLSAVGLLKYYDQIAQVAYDNFFDLPTAPPAPFVAVWDKTQSPPVLVTGASELDGEIVLDWSKDPQRVMETETFDEKGYSFQGYNVYQLPSAAASVTEGVRIATYDIRDGVGKIDDLVFDVTTGSVVTLPVQFGNDTGIKRFISITQDAINQIPLINGIRYYFAVTSYNYNPDPNAVPNNLENPIQIITAIPHATNPGVTIGEGSGVGLDLTHTGTADGVVTAEIVDPYAVTGDNYEISFFPQAQIRNEEGFWVEASQTIRKFNPDDPDTLTGTTIDIAAVYAGDGVNTELQFHLDVVHHYYGWVDGVTLTFPEGINIIDIPPVVVSGTDDGGSEPVEIEDMGAAGVVVRIGVTDNSQTQGGHFHEGGEDWVIYVDPSSYTLPLSVDWIAHDDGYAGGQNEEGTTTVSEIGFASRTAELWQMTNTTTSQVVLPNQSVYTGTDRWPPTDFSNTDLGPDAATVVEGLQVNVDVGFEAPINFFSTELIPVEGSETSLTSSSSTTTLDIQNYTIFGGVISSKAIDNFGVGTNELLDLQQDYEYRFTGVYDEGTVINGVTVRQVISGGQWATCFRMVSGGALATHPLNPNYGTAEPFLIRIPFEVWNVDDPENPYQVNLTYRDRVRDGSEDPFWAWNPENRMYAIIVNSPYDSTQVIQVDGGPDQFNDPATWVTVHYGTNYTIGDAVKITYANPIVYEVDKWTFSTTGEAYSNSLAGNQVDEINVFPNPYYGVNTEEVNKYNRFVTFTHLPQRANIKIFNLAGVLVKNIEKDDEDQYQRWDLANNSGLPVASGLYIAYIELPDLGKTKILKVAVIQEQQILDRF